MTERRKDGVEVKNNLNWNGMMLMYKTDDSH